MIIHTVYEFYIQRTVATNVPRLLYTFFKSFSDFADDDVNRDNDDVSYSHAMYMYSLSEKMLSENGGNASLSVLNYPFRCSEKLIFWEGY